MSPWLSRNRIFEIVMSGNSSRSCASTSPIERCWLLEVELESCGSPPVMRRSPTAEDEREHEAADLELLQVGAAVRVSTRSWST